MNGLRQNDHFYDTNTNLQRGNSHQSQTLHRRPSRHFDAFAYQQDGLNGPDNMSLQRYDNPRYDRMNPSMQTTYNGYDMSMPQAWNSNGYSHNSALAASGATLRMKPPANRGRPGIPTMWMEQNQNPPTSNGFPNLGNPNMGPLMLRQEHSSMDNEEDLIPTAIVIKNIPFAVKKEQLVQVMTDMCLPLPYAFNYHFDNGVFRGLAFANFTTAEETAAVIQSMNHLELHGRKLRVEYKKMLPQAERDRIEREKRERRGQLEEQHRPVVTTQLQTRPSISSLSNGIRAVSPAPPTPRNAQTNLDMNDPTTLSYFSKLILFTNDATQGDVIRFPAQIPPHDRKVIHGLAHQLGLGHESQGVGEQRQVCVFRTGLPGLSPSLPQTAFGMDQNRRGLYRAATTDFTDSRDPSFFNTLGRQSSGYLFTDNQQSEHTSANNLRAAKSFADLRSYSPSPSLTNSHFPPNLSANIARFNDYNPNGIMSSRSNLQSGTPASSNSADPLVTSMSNMALGSGFPNRQESPQRLRGMISWDTQPQQPPQSGAPGPIGGHRSLSTSIEDQSRARTQNGAPSRQPRGPALDRGTGFSRGRQAGHQTHGSDEMLSHNGVETVVE